MEENVKLIYIVGTFPAFSTAFIDREIRSMRNRGVDLHIVAIRRPSADQPLSEEQRELQRDVTYLLPVATLQLIIGHLLFLFSRPLAFFGTLGYLLTRPHPTLKARIMTVLHFAEGVHAAYLIRNRTFDHLHAHFVDRAAIVALVASRLLNVPYSLTAHANDIYVNPVLLPEKIEHAKFITTCTGYNHKYLNKALGSQLNGKLYLAYHGLDLSNYEPAETPPQRTRPLLLSVGRLTEKKGFSYLINACRDLKAEGYDFECHIVGPGPLQETLEAQIKQCDLEGIVTLCGGIPHEQVVEKYQRAVAFVLPCIIAKDGDRDGIPNVLIEAMAMQLPVVSTDHSGIPELVENNVNGLLVPPNDEVALRDALRKILDAPESYKDFGIRARQKVLNDFELERNTTRLHALFAN